MSFTRINPSKATDDEQFLCYPVDAAKNADNIPIFLIPGILGCGDIGSIASALAELNPDRPIYLWEDPGLNTWNNVANFKSLEAQARDIGREIMHIHGSSKIPPVLVGFSSGCPIATLTAQLFHANGVTPFLYVIDGATRALTYENFTRRDKKPLVIKDLILIIETIAKRAGIENPPRLPNDTISIVNNTMQIEERAKKYSEFLCDLIKKCLSDTEFHDFKQNFDQQFRVVYRNLRNMRLKPDAKTAALIQKPLPYLTAFLTQELLDKYPHAPLAGWSQETENLVVINNECLSKATHLDLVSHEGLINFIAEAIIEKLNKDAAVINAYIAGKAIDNAKFAYIQQFANNSENLPKRLVIDLSSSPSLSDDEKSEEEPAEEQRQRNALLSSSPTSSDENNRAKAVVARSRLSSASPTSSEESSSPKCSTIPSALFSIQPASPPVARRNAYNRNSPMRASF